MLPREGNPGSRLPARRRGFPTRTLGKLWVRWSLGESRSRAPSLFYCVKSSQRLCPDHSNSIAKLIITCHSLRCGYTGTSAINGAISYAKFFSRSDDAVIRVYGDADNVIKRTSTRAISKSGEYQPRRSQSSI
jgi:hypothetical protein